MLLTPFTKPTLNRALLYSEKLSFWNALRLIARSVSACVCFYLWTVATSFLIRCLTLLLSHIFEVKLRSNKHTFLHFYHALGKICSLKGESY